GGDDQGRGSDRQPSVDEAERVVVGGEGPDDAMDRERAVMNWAGWRGRCGAGWATTRPGARQLLSVLEARDRGVKARVGVAVLAVLVVCGHGQPGRRHMQGPGCEREAVVDGGEATDRAGDAVVRNRTCRCRRRRAAGGPGHA